MTRTRPLAMGAAQTIPVRGQVDANLEQHLRLVHAAAREQLQLLVFPELSLTGYELDLADHLAFSEDDPRLEPLTAVGSSCGMTLIVGAPVRLGARLHIGAFILGADGTVGLYTKHHLGAFPIDSSADGIVPAPEANFFHPGALNPLVRFNGNTAAVAICADANQPSHPRQAADRGAKIYLASMFVIPRDLDQDAARLQAYARHQSMSVVFANYGGPSGGLASGGCSAIWSDAGDLLIQLENTGVGIAIAVKDDNGWRGKAVVAPVA